MNRRFLNADMAKCEVRVDDDGIPHIVGYGAVFYREGDPGTEFRIGKRWVERISPNALDRAVKEDDVRGLHNHDSNRLLGRTKSGTMKLSVDSRGMFFDIRSDPDSTIHRDTIAAIKRGDLDGSSFAFNVKKESYEDLEDGTVLRTIEEVETLFDTGPVTYPAYEGATAGIRSADIESAEAGFKAHEERKAQSENQVEEITKARFKREKQLRNLELI